MEELSLPISFSHFFVKLKGEFEIRKYELYNETQSERYEKAIQVRNRLNDKKITLLIYFRYEVFSNKSLFSLEHANE